MAKKANIIELNGKRYDARTGELLDVLSHGPKPDGILDHQTAGQHKPKRQVMDVTRPSTRHLKHHAARKSQTLMRSVVSKPAPRHKTKAVVHTHALVTQPQFKVVEKLSHPNVDVNRARHAKLVPQSKLISRFGEPAQAVVHHPTVHHAPKKHPVPQPVAIHAIQAPASQPASVDVFQRALERANSHLEPEVKPAKKARKHKKHSARRIVSISAGALAVVLLAGFIAFQNQPNLTMRYASSKAGFAASLPSYEPEGYKVGRFIYSPGVVGVKFANSDSGQSYSVIQQQSNWDSQALVDSFVTAQSGSYDTVNSAGRIIYTYGEDSATWVNGGIWYRVTSDGGLTTNDLVNIAASI